MRFLLPSFPAPRLTPVCYNLNGTSPQHVHRLYLTEAQATNKLILIFTLPCRKTAISRREHELHSDMRIPEETL